MSLPLPGRIAAALAAAASAALPPAARGQVVYSGPVNLTIPYDFTGLYVNVVTGTSFAGPGLVPTCPGPGCNYDFNIYGTAPRLFFAPVTPVETRGYVSTSATGNPVVLAPGTLIGATSVFNSEASTSSGAAFEGGAARIFGFRFVNEVNNAYTVHYGWARISLPPGAAGTLVDYAYEATPGAAIAAGATAVVPEPSTFALLGAGLAGAGAAARRRRTA